MSQSQRWYCGKNKVTDNYEPCSEMNGQSGICFQNCFHSIHWNDLRENPKTADIIAGLEWQFGNNNYAEMSKWLKSPCLYLAGALPIDLINSKDEDEIDRVVFAVIQLTKEESTAHGKYHF